MIKEIERVPLSTLFIKSEKTGTKMKAKEIKERNETNEQIKICAKFLLQEMIQAFKSGKRECFDAHALDFGCERRALSVYMLCFDKTLIQEIENLEKNLEHIGADKILLSKKCAYLVQCFFLRYFRMTIVKKNDLNKEDFTLNESLIKEKFKSTRKYCGDIIAKVRKEVSSASFDFMQSQSSFTLANKLDKGLTITSCFYSYKITMDKVKELSIPILIKKMVKKNERSFGFLCRYSEQKVFEEVIEKLEGPIIVIEGDVRDGLDKTFFKELAFKKGILNVLTCCVALDEKICREDQEVQNCLEQKFDYLDCSPEQPVPFFKIDHVFCSTLKEEENRLLDMS